MSGAGVSGVGVYFELVFGVWSQCLGAGVWIWCSGSGVPDLVFLLVFLEQVFLSLCFCWCFLGRCFFCCRLAWPVDGHQTKRVLGKVLHRRGWAPLM